MIERETIKTCTKCGEEKPLGEFGVLTANSDGRNNICKECKKEYDSKYRSTNKSVIRFNSKKWENKNKKYRKEYQIEYREKNRDLRREKSKIYRNDPENIDRIRAARKNYRSDPKTSEKFRLSVLKAAKEYRDGALDPYIKRMLIQKGFRKDQITPELMGAQRNVIKLKRAIKEKTK